MKKFSIEQGSNMAALAGLVVLLVNKFFPSIMLTDADGVALIAGAVVVVKLVRDYLKTQKSENLTIAGFKK